MTLYRTYFVRKTLLAFAIRHPECLLNNDAKVIDLIVKLATETVNARLALKGLL